MKKSWICLCVCFVFLVSLAVPAGAAWHYVRDEADILTQQEEDTLQQLSQKISDSYGLDVVILTVDSLDGVSAQSYADDYYDYNGFSSDGLLFLLAMGEREWHISTAGNAIVMLSDGDLAALEDSFLPHFIDGNYGLGFEAFLESMPRYLETQPPAETYYDAQGNVYAVYDQEDGGINWLISVLAGAVIAAIAVGIMSGTMNTKRAQRTASGYQSESGFRLTTNQDLFLYSNISKQPKPQNTTSSGGARSTIHHSSSGSSHGGRGGKF